MTSLAVCLVLLLDVSASVGSSHWEAMRAGHARAFMDGGIAGVIGRSGGVAVAARWFAEGTGVLVPWRVLADERASAGYGEDFLAVERPPGSSTNIERGMDGALDDFAAAPGECDERVVDVVTDGQDQGLTTAPRDRAEAMGVRVNGLMVGGAGESDRAWLERQAVTRATGLSRAGFALWAAGWEAFADAIRKKLTIELADASP